MAASAFASKGSVSKRVLTRYWTNSSAALSFASRVSHAIDTLRRRSSPYTCSMSVVLPLPAGASMRIALLELPINSSMSASRRREWTEIPGGLNLDNTSDVG